MLLTKAVFHSHAFFITYVILRHFYEFSLQYTEFHKYSAQDIALHILIKGVSHLTIIYSDVHDKC